MPMVTSQPLILSTNAASTVLLGVGRTRTTERTLLGLTSYSGPTTSVSSRMNDYQGKQRGERRRERDARASGPKRVVPRCHRTYAEVTGDISDLQYCLAVLK